MEGEENHHGAIHREGLFGLDFSKLKCTLEAFSNADKCADSTNGQGELCSFCSMVDENSGKEVGMCVDPDLAPNMQEMNPEISCTNVDNYSKIVKEVESLQDYHDFKCTIKALNDADKCSHVHTQDGRHRCEYCSMNGPLGEKGVCVSPAHARKLERITPTIHCSHLGSNDAELSQDEITSVESAEKGQRSAISDCNLSGTDLETCLDPSKVNGSKCIWCDAAIGGFCFPQSWSKTAGRFLKCVDADTPSDMISNVQSPWDSNCLKIGFKGDEGVDECRNAVDEESGEHCVFCKAPALGGVGLCMPPQWKGNGGKFYECDSDKVNDASSSVNVM